MSLLSNRGRFTKDNLINKENDLGLKSSLSLIGKNPIKFFKIDIDSDHFNVLNKRISSLSFKNQNNEGFASKHEEYNNNILKKNNKLFSTNNNESSNNNKNSAMHTAARLKRLILMLVVEIFTIVGIAWLGIIIRSSKMTQSVSFDKEQVQNKNIDEATLAVMKGFKTVAIFGLDSRTGSVDKGNNSDVNIIANLNLETGEAELVSIYRDLYLSITNNNQYDKLNAAYRKGGPEQAVKTINKCFDLNITNFFSFNWKAVADCIELLGGIDLEITKSEYRYMNAFIHETCIATGIDSKNPAAHYIKSAGLNHLDGVQAVAYGRLRLMDSDFQRVERQKKVISLCLEKAKKLNIPKLRQIMDAVLPQIAYEFELDEMLQIVRIINKINIVESCGVPKTNNLVTMDMGNCGDCIVALSLEKAVIELHRVLFGDYEYKVSDAVKRYSNRIDELRLKYAEENAIKASEKAREKEESERLESESLAKKHRRASSSNTNKNDKNKYTNPDLPSLNEIIIPDLNDYEEEPEEDVVVGESPLKDNNNKSSIPVNDVNADKKTNNVDNYNNNIPNVQIGTGPPGSFSGNNITSNQGPMSVPNSLSAPELGSMPGRGAVGIVTGPPGFENNNAINNNTNSFPSAQPVDSPGGFVNSVPNNYSNNAPH